METVVIIFQDVFNKNLKTFIVNGKILGIKKVAFEMKALKILIPLENNKNFNLYFNGIDHKNDVTVKIGEKEYYGEAGYSDETNILSLLLNSKIKEYSLQKKILFDIRI
nr:MAG TPA: hypothetical protein [Caudoviricetes sp.]